MSTVIVVDDNEELASLLARRISERGVHAVSAASGEKAVEFFDGEVERPLLCLLDVVMPGLKGVNLMREIKKRAPATRFILCTGYVDIPEIQQMRDEGVLDVLYKPFKIEDLVAKIKFVLSNIRKVSVS